MKPTGNKTPGKTFHVELSGYYPMTVDDLWPDGDAPEDPTTDDVIALIEEAGGAARIIRDWDLDNDLDLSVDGKSVR